MNLEEHNLREIEGLSQRGRTLSIVDLIAANTINADMAAHSLYAIAHGASFLTAARPGNAGKTTLMACLLTFLPPENLIITTSSPSVVTEARNLASSATRPENVCFLCHEIGSGHWHGYLWGKHVGELLHLTRDGFRVASCIHADTLPEMRDIMVSRELGVSEEDFAGIDLLLFMNLSRSISGYRRRVATFYESGDGSGDHNLLFSWKPDSDTFDQHSDPVLLKKIARQRGLRPEQAAEELQKCRLFIENLMSSGNTDFRWVRKQVLDFYSENQFT